MLQLRHFSPEEFIRGGIDWWPYMSPRLLVQLDLVRFQWGQRIDVSSHGRALGRRLGNKNASQHNIDVWNEVRAVDCFPLHARTRKHAEYLIDRATRCGITGIGVYPHWVNRKGQQVLGFHWDNRENVPMGSPATWGGINDAKGKQYYVSMEEALSRLPKE